MGARFKRLLCIGLAAVLLGNSMPINVNAGELPVQEQVEEVSELTEDVDADDIMPLSISENEMEELDIEEDNEVVEDTEVADDGDEVEDDGVIDNTDVTDDDASEETDTSKTDITSKEVLVEEKGTDESVVTNESTEAEGENRETLEEDSISANSLSENDLDNSKEEIEEDLITVDLSDPSADVYKGYIEIDKEPFASIYELPEGYPRLYAAEDPLPVNYRNKNIPDTRNQNPYGTCWAHASVAVAEANAMKQGMTVEEEENYSELHLAYFSYHDVTDILGGLEGDIRAVGDEKSDFLDHGGNSEQATRTMFAWYGAADEDTAPYTECSQALVKGLDDDIAFMDKAHLKNAYQINPVTEREEAKRLIYEYGALTASYFAAQSGYRYTWDGGNTYYYFDDIYNSENNAYYFPVEDVNTNHAVTIVGWDDNFAKEKFAIQPEGDGAWLIRNSWTTGNEENYDGYFWMSYYDKSLYEESFAYEMDTEDNYHNNYQYDGTYFSIRSGYSTCANVFEAKACEEGESLEAIAFETDDTNVNYTIQIYTDILEDGGPMDGTISHTQSGQTKYSGYLTVDLNSPVPLDQGERFSVVVTLEKEGYSPSVNRECTYTYNGFNTVAGIDPGESYVYSGGWIDRSTLGTQNANNCIKAYTNNISGRVQATDINVSNLPTGELTLGVEEVFRMIARVVPVNAENRTLTYTSSDEDVVTVSADGQLTGISEGDATITISTTNDITKQIAVTVVEKVNSLTINKIDSRDYLTIGHTYTFTASHQPSTVTPKGSIKWYSENPNVVSIDEDTGVATALDVGPARIRAELDGVSATYDIRVHLENLDFTGYADENSVVNINWAPVEGAVLYQVRDMYGNILYECEEDGSEIYYYTDETYKGATELRSVYYAVYAFDKTGFGWGTYSNIAIGPCYKVNYVLPHGTNHEKNMSYYRAGMGISIYNPTMDPGYTFGGWYTESEYKNRIYYISTNSSGDVTLYAKVSPIFYYMEYLANDGTDGAKYDTVDYDQEFTLSKDMFTRDGYNLVGWNTRADGSGESYEADQVVSNLTTTAYDTITLYAQWERIIKKASISYEIPHGANSPYNPSEYIVGNEVHLEDPIADTGYYFEDWYLDKEYTKPTDGVLSTDTENLTFYAKITPISYSVKYNYNDDTMEDEVIFVSYDEDIVIKTNIYEKSRYKFAGWNTKADGSGVTYQEEQVVRNLTINDGETITLYAQWTEIDKMPCTTPTISINGEVTEGIVGADNELTVVEGAGLLITADANDIIYYAFLADNQEVIDEYQEYTDEILIEDGMRISIYATREDSVFFKESETITVAFKVQPAEERELRIEGLQDAYEYTGSYIKPKITVYDGSKELTVRKDYKVSYSNNKRIGQATVIVQGCGNYNDRISKNFEIKPILINEDDFHAKDMTIAFSSKNQKPIPILYRGNRKLSARNDYYVQYYQAIATEDGYVKEGEALTSVKDSGHYKIYLVGKGNYTGEIAVDLEILQPQTILASKFTVSRIGTLTYNNGQEVRPEKLTVKYKNEKLIEGDDYTLSYENNTKVGTATVIIHGINDFGGTKRVNYRIKGISLRANNISGIAATYPYNGKAVEPFGAVENNDDTGWAKVICGKDAEGNPKVLTKGTDYCVVSYKNNYDKGTATVVLEGMNGYSGRISKNYRITSAKMSQGNLTVEVNCVTQEDGSIVASYNKSGAKPSILSVYAKITDKDGITWTKELSEGRDYTVTYSNNTVISADGRVAKLIIKGKGNYSGVLATKEFQVVRRDISEMDAVAKDVVYNGKSNNYKTIVEIVEPDSGKRLNYGDYNSAFRYLYDHDVIVDVKNGDTIEKRYREKGEEVRAEDIIPAKTVLRLVVDGKNTYTGSIEVTYRVVEKSLSKVTATIKPKEYTGKQVTISKKDISSIKINGVELKESDYRIVKYINNTKTGKATVIIEGIGKFGGRKAITYNIVRRAIK